MNNCYKKTLSDKLIIRNLLDSYEDNTNIMLNQYQLNVIKDSIINLNSASKIAVRIAEFIKQTFKEYLLFEKLINEQEFEKYELTFNSYEGIYNKNKKEYFEISTNTNSSLTNGVTKECFIVKMYLNDGLNNLKIYNENTIYEMEKYNETLFFANEQKIKKRILDYMTKNKHIGEITTEKWNYGTYISFNIYIDTNNNFLNIETNEITTTNTNKKDKDNNIILLKKSELYFNTVLNKTILEVGKEYYIAQTIYINHNNEKAIKENKIHPNKKWLLEKIEYNYLKRTFEYKFVMKRKTKKDKYITCYSSIVKGNIGIEKSNINRMENHFIISEYKDTFVDELLSLFKQDFIIHSDIKNKKRMRKLIKQLKKFI